MTASIRSFKHSQAYHCHHNYCLPDTITTITEYELLERLLLLSIHNGWIDFSEWVGSQAWLEQAIGESQLQPLPHLDSTTNYERIGWLSRPDLMFLSHYVRAKAVTMLALATGSEDYFLHSLEYWSAAYKWASHQVL